MRTKSAWACVCHTRDTHLQQLEAGGSHCLVWGQQGGQGCPPVHPRRTRAPGEERVPEARGERVQEKVQQGGPWLPPEACQHFAGSLHVALHRNSGGKEKQEATKMQAVGFGA